MLVDSIHRNGMKKRHEKRIRAVCVSTTDLALLRRRLTSALEDRWGELDI
jgi:hypothetical protein